MSLSRVTQSYATFKSRIVEYSWPLFLRSVGLEMAASVAIMH